MICTAHQMYSADEISKNEKGGPCSMYGGDERLLQGFDGETFGKGSSWKTQAYIGGYY
jgi:hypothetical protein